MVWIVAKDVKMKIDDSSPIPFTFLKGAMAWTEGRAMIAVIMLVAYTKSKGRGRNKPPSLQKPEDSRSRVAKGSQ